MAEGVTCSLTATAMFLKFYFSVLSGSMQISSVSKKASYKILLQLQRSKQGFAVMSGGGAAGTGGSQSTQDTSHSSASSSLFHPYWTGYLPPHGSLMKKQNYFILQVDYFCWIYLRLGEQPGPSHPDPSPDRDRQRQTSEEDDFRI